MAYTDPNAHVFVTGEVVSAANLKTYVGDNIVALRNGLVCHAAKNTLPNIATNTITTLSFEVDIYDNAAIHSTVSATDRLTFPIAGIWHIGAALEYAFDADGIRTIEGWINGTYVYALRTIPAPPGVAVLGFSDDYVVAASDYIIFRTYHEAGNNLALQGMNGGAGPGAKAWCHFVGAGL